MRKRLTSKEKQLKKEKRNQRIFAIIFLGILLFGTVGYGFMSSSDEEESSSRIFFGNQEFYYQNGYWLTQVGENIYYLHYSPNETSSLDYDSNNLVQINGYSNQPLYVVSEDENAYYEVYINFQNIVLRMQEACLEGEDCVNENLPVKTCEDNVIFVKISEENKIIQNESCVFIEGKREDLIKLIDEFVYKILEINE